MTTKDAIKHLSWKISFAQQCSTHWADCVNVDALEIAVRAMAEGRKKGKWIGKPIAGYCTVRCSVCRNVFMENNGRWNFCPDCGADMRGEQDAETN